MVFYISILCAHFRLESCSLEDPLRLSILALGVASEAGEGQLQGRVELLNRENHFSYGLKPPLLAENERRPGGLAKIHGRKFLPPAPNDKPFVHCHSHIILWKYDSSALCPCRARATFPATGSLLGSTLSGLK